MRAAWYEAIGAARDVLRVGDMPRPEPGRGEVLVRVHASGINPSDTKRRSGWFGATLPFSRIVPHGDGAGVVEAVGPGVPSSRIGERVWLYHAQAADRPFGTAAEYTAVPADHALPLPDGVSFAEGACLGVPACTAHRAVFADGPVAGRTVLIPGGAGAVGHYAVQFARQDGATVIATVSAPEKAAHARAGGADHAIDYRREDVVAEVMALTDGAGVDRVVEVDFGTNLAIDVAVIKPNGVIASYSSTKVPEPVFPYYPLAYKGVTVRLIQAYVLPEGARRAALDAITDGLRAGRLQHTVGARFPLSEIAAGHEAVESGRVIGNVVVEV